MIGGLERVVRWRDASEETPQQVGRVFVANMTPDADGDPLTRRVPSCRAAYWNGREFQTGESPFWILKTVTHWMPYPDLPSEKAMREAFRCLLGAENEEGGNQYDDA